MYDSGEGGRGGGVNKKAKDEIFSYIKSARRLSSISPRIYHIYKKFLQNVCIMKRRAKKGRGGVYNVSAQNLFTLRFDEI